MIVVPELTAELLAALKAELGGCDFSGASQRAFLSSTESCDVQAAPGNGKTTLLVAKLSLLSRRWTSRTQGVCVISHTNAARIEVEKRLASHAAAAAFLNYPHFIGTVTTFIDRYIALPYLRGLGWPVRRIDDAVFATIACTRIASNPTLRTTARRQEKSVKDWVSNLELSPLCNCQPGPVPDRLAVRAIARQPGVHTASGVELEQIKASMVRDGYYRFGDMTTLANRALDHCPGLVEHIRARFPLVILDEAQDTHGPQLALLKRLFGQGPVAFQLLGDQNQTLYEDSALAPGDYWQPAADAIPLNETRRFGTTIAEFASRLTVRRPQAITGIADSPGYRGIWLFDRNSVTRVIPSYAALVQGYWRDGLPEGHETWAVSSRHNIYRDQRGDWPKSLVDYHPPYRAGTAGSSKPSSLCAALRQAATMHAAHEVPARVMDTLCQSMAELLRHAGYRGPHATGVTINNLWRVLASDGGKHISVRHLLYIQILTGDAVWNAVGWTTFVNELAAIIGFAEPRAGRIDQLSQFLEFVEQGADVPLAEQIPVSRNSVTHAGLTVRLGSIHTVKGRTVDAMLVMESQVYRGQAADEKAMDITTVLPHALGLENRDFTSNYAQLTAATNVFVGITRPRTLLGLALRRASMTDAMIRAAELQGWQLHDLTA